MGESNALTIVLPSPIDMNMNLYHFEYHGPKQRVLQPVFVFTKHSQEHSFFFLRFFQNFSLAKSYGLAAMQMLCYFKMLLAIKKSSEQDQEHF